MVSVSSALYWTESPYLSPIFADVEVPLFLLMGVGHGAIHPYCWNLAWSNVEVMFVAEFKVCWMTFVNSSIWSFSLNRLWYLEAARVWLLERYYHLVWIHFLTSLFVISSKPLRVLCLGLPEQLRVLRVLLEWLSNHLLTFKRYLVIAVSCYLDGWLILSVICG